VGSGGKDPRILNFGIDARGWSASRSARLTFVPIGQEARWAPEPVWMRWRGEKIPSPQPSHCTDWATAVRCLKANRIVSEKHQSPSLRSWNPPEERNDRHLQYGAAVASGLGILMTCKDIFSTKGRFGNTVPATVFCRDNIAPAVVKLYWSNWSSFPYFLCRD